MRAQTACTMLLLAAAVVSAQTCTSPAAGDTFATSNYGSCATITTCQKALCACTGSTSSDFTGCLKSNTKGCTDVQTCYATYFTCLLTTTAVRSNSSDACSAYGSALYVAQLAAATATAINTSTLYQSCAYNLCTLRNATGSTSSCTTMESTVCGSSVLLPTATTLAPVSSTPVIVVTLRLAGANWSAVLNDPTKKAAAITAITNDLAKLLGIDARFIVIIALSVGSLVVQFSVQDGSGKTAAQLSTAVGTATSSSTWLSSTSSVYSAVGSDTISATSVATTTAAPGQTLPPNTPAPTTGSGTSAPTSSAMSAAGVWAVAAVAAVAALLA